jgi:hypothetical protein
MKRRSYRFVLKPAYRCNKSSRLPIKRCQKQIPGYDFPPSSELEFKQAFVKVQLCRSSSTQSPVCHFSRQSLVAKIKMVSRDSRGSLMPTKARVVTRFRSGDGAICHSELNRLASLSGYDVPCGADSPSIGLAQNDGDQTYQSAVSVGCRFLEFGSNMANETHWTVAHWSPNRKYTYALAQIAAASLQ